MRRSQKIAIFWGAGFLASLIGLLAAFLLSLAASARHFDRAAIAEAQRVAVSRIEAMTASGHGDRAALAASLDQYRHSIEAEKALLDHGQQAAQDRETGDAVMLSRLALAPSSPRQRSDLHRLVAKIAEREQAESARVAAEMTALRIRMSWIAVLLVLAAAGSALIGVAGLRAANRKLADQVARRTEELAAVDRSRRLFFAKASHELRTPVTVMRGEAEVALADGAADIGDLREALGHVVANAEFLEHRIDELLGLARADDGQLRLEQAPLDLVALVTGANEAAEAYARSAEINLAVEAPPAPLMTRGDPRWLRQALLAVLDNAVKFSPAGTTVSMRLSRQAEGARIEIRDQGRGVAPAELPRIFDAYYQTQAGRARGGTGLGLALARWVVEHHGGSISASNDPEGGCRVAISLPVAA